MFDSVAEAVQAHRAAAVEHHSARDRRDPAGMDAAVARIREVTVYLRGRGRPELIQPLTMEWVTQGRDEAAHARHRREVDALHRESPPTTERATSSTDQPTPPNDLISRPM